MREHTHTRKYKQKPGKRERQERQRQRRREVRANASWYIDGNKHLKVWFLYQPPKAIYSSNSCTEISLTADSMNVWIGKGGKFFLYYKFKINNGNMSIGIRKSIFLNFTINEWEASARAKIRFNQWLLLTMVNKSYEISLTREKYKQHMVSNWKQFLHVFYMFCYY